MTTKNNSEDKHLGHGYFTRLDGVDETRFQAYLKRPGLTAGRVIKQAIREFLDRAESNEHEEQN